MAFENYDDVRLTVPRAAARLGVSATTMHKMLDNGDIPYEVPAAKHRRVKLSDLLAYQRGRRYVGAVMPESLRYDPLAD